ncbi:hypothetical protein GWG54_12215 [Natronococcus sp. JC468]|uniref:HalOD1 output domain-containing protein n=1 Tax=Natronococcus sp. JC468 TaxID=1961921 RepID=UPI001439B5A0|nr:HalOD1 output domain-containing protein [Natronococcus sp. JC468]NKE36570.1 hypothetical protein [Natronococcus sp. JC468]
MVNPELGVQIVRQIAAHEGIDAADLEPPLQAVVDVDALERLVHPCPQTRTDFTGSVSFVYADYQVTVDHTGAVSVSPTQDAVSDAGPDRQAADT